MDRFAHHGHAVNWFLLLLLGIPLWFLEAQGFYIVALCVGASALYGILHDQVTARVCVEYFTIGHPRLFHTDDPTLLAIGWGIVATWWVGVIVGVSLAYAARAGTWPRRTASSLIRPVACLLLVTACCAAAAGVLGWRMAARGDVDFLILLPPDLPADKRVPFVADLYAHAASYLAGFVGGMLVITWVLWSRRREARTGRTVRTVRPWSNPHDSQEDVPGF